MPPSHRSRLLYGVGDTAFSEGVDEDSGIAESVAAEDLFPESVQDKEHRNQDSRAPIRERTPLKVKGPTYSMPTLWATKAIPQIVAARSRQREFFRGIFCEFMIKNPFVY